MTPLRDPSLLDDNYSQYCVNAFLYKGTVRGFRENNPVFKCKLETTTAVYRIPNKDTVKPDFLNSLWLEFDDEYISVLRSPVIEDKFKRYYFFPSTGSPYFNTLENLQNGAPGYLLGVPVPETAPTVEGPVGSDEARSYGYTWVNQFGEEGQLSPTTTLIGPAIGDYILGLTPPLPSDLEDRALASINIYRTVTDTSGNAEFFLLANVPITQTTFADTVPDNVLANNLQLPSAGYSLPPVDLQGVVQMANGIMAGWSNEKEVWFSDPYIPHSWPSGYAVNVDAPIVGLAAVGSSLAILTEGSPWMATGITPSTITFGKIAANEPCISRGSIVAAGEGIYYASPNGLQLVNTSGTTSATQSIFQKEDWIGTNPYIFAAGKYSQAYVALLKGSANFENGIVIDHGAYSLVTLYPAKLNTPFTYLNLPGPLTNIYNDELSGQVFFLAGGLVYQWNPETATSLLPYVWRSKDYRFPFDDQFSCGTVYFAIPPTVTIPTPESKTRNTNQDQVYDPETQYLLMRVFADGRQVLVREIQVSGEVFKVPSGFKATYWSFQFEGIVTVRYAEFATSVKELRKT